MHGPQHTKDYNLNKRLVPQPLHSPAYHSMQKKQKIGENLKLMNTVLYIQHGNPQICTKWVLKAQPQADI